MFEKDFTIIAGPCSVESEEQLRETIAPIYQNIDILRGGAFKPRTFSHKFQGLGEEGLKILAKISKEFNLPVITEVMDTETVELVASYADILQVGARNMHNYSLLKKIGKTNKPVFLKRGLAATITEWLAATEYIGSQNIILCERGIRTFGTETRFTLDLAGAVLASQLSKFPVIIDPSHATGKKELIKPLCKATKAAGLKGIMVEVHCEPSKAKSDSEQALTPKEFNQLYEEL